MSEVPPEARHESPGTVAIFVQCSRHDIVLFQALFESYEGVGTVRTVDRAQGVISILTVPDMYPTALNVLRSLPAEFPWRFACHLHPAEKSRYGEML